MWFERFVIVVGPLTHDFMPYAWGDYWPSWIEGGILLGSFSFFFFLFLIFVKFLPSVSITEMKEMQEAPVMAQGTMTGRGA
jgi:molybdopterin-containing oxidoreductase family membrane subunit